MNYSYGLSSALATGFFYNLGGDISHFTDRYSIQYEENNIFSRFLEVSISNKGKFFIPALNINTSLSLISNWLESSGNASTIKIEYPLLVRAGDRKKTADAILTSIANCPHEYRISKITTSKGLDYYAGSGIICNEYWEPMMICGFIIEIGEFKFSGLETRNVIKVLHPICYIAPSVFENNDILSKAIIKKVIPYFSSTRPIVMPRIITTNGNIINTLAMSTSSIPVPIVIKDIDTYFSSPAELKNIDTLDDDIWKFLSENSEDLKLSN